jgi:hypothetical protein
MIKSYLSLILCFCALTFGFGQIITFDFVGLAGNEVSANSNFNDPNLSVSTITRGSGLTAANNAGRFNAINWAVTSIANAVAGNDYMEFTITPNTSYEFEVTTIDVNFQRSGTGPRGIALRSSLDGYTANIDGEKVIIDNIATQTFTFTINQTNNSAAVTYRIYGWAEATGGSGGFEGAGNDIVVNGTVNSTATNTTVQFTTTTSSIAENGTFIDVCASITNPSASNATTVDITLDGASTAINGTDYEDNSGVAISFPATLTFPVGSSVDQCLRIFVSDDVVVEGDETIVLNLANPNGGDSAALGTNTQHVVTIVDDEALVLADVVITEIMYNTSGDDDEWIEICNVSGSAQVLNNYLIEYDGNPIFTFPSTGAVIADGDCITVSLGSNGDGVYNVDCPFTPDYGIDASTNNTDNLVNNTATISLIASDGITTIDSVTYDDNDGALTDGNGASFHIIDTALDNSNTDTNWQEVIDGGSPGTNSLISPCSAVEPDINVEGDLGSFPDISNNDVTPSFLDNTRFSNTIIGNSQTKSFRIQNTGTVDLNVSNIQIIGGAGDFTLTLPPGLPYSIAPNNLIVFDVTFAPSAAITRTATLRITSDDPDENPFEFAIEGTGICDATTNTLTPLTGPDNTIVTITGSDLGGTTTVEFGGVNLAYTVISGTEIEITIPANSVTGNITVTNNLGCVSSDLFTVIDNAIGSCEGTGGTTPTELFISEVTDANTGGLTYVEIYNGTGVPINLGTYSVQFFNNGSATQNGGSTTLNAVILNSGDTYVLEVSTGSNCTGIPGSDGSLADQSGFGGINFGVNSDDHIRLFNGTTHIDSWGTYLSDTWADPLGIDSEGVVFTRNDDAATLPNTVFNLADWTYVDWTDCSENDYSDIGNFDFSTGVPPTVTGISSSTTSCNEVTISVNASEGFVGVGSNPLVYVWYAYDPANAGLGWQLITNGGIYNGADTANLVITDAASVVDYQFYCQVREDDATCFTASDAVQITISTATWDGVNWNWNDGTAQNTLPNLSTNVVINGNYSTGIGGIQTSFSACNLIVIGGNALTIDNNTFIQIQNNIIANGDINVSSQGSVVQIDDSGTVSGSGVMQVTKRTAPMNNAFEYTYWSSPVSNATINSALAQSDVNRRFIFNAQNYLDATAEIGNNNATVAGQDDIDDNGDDWTLVGGATTMEPGVGYASAHDPTLFASTPGVPPYQFDYIFEGTFNTGVITVPIYRNDSEMADNNWNFIGNPYPSAIDADDFLTFNSSIAQTVGATNGAIFLWSQNTAPDGNANGNQNLNFAQGDYAIINGTGETAGGDGISPSRHIPSGQGFFVAMDDAAASTIVSGSIRTTDIVFNNSMRVTGNNDLFFRNNFSEQPDKLWLNLTSDNGVFSQILVAYIEGASNNFDGMYYDAFKNKSSNLYSGLYTSIQNSDKKFAIQGKDPNSLSIDEIIEIGFNTSIQEPTIYTISIAQFEGQFLSENPIYLKDKLLNTIHNLKESDYTFTSEAGEFNDRFEIVFQDNALSTNEFDINPNDLKIVELGNGLVEFSIAKNHTIKEVVILDVIGREIYRLPGSSSVEVYNLEKLTKAAYIAQVELSNGQIITKKAIKRN